MNGTALTTRDAAPVPTELTARTRYEYGEPLVKPEATAVRPLTTADDDVLHVTPPSVVSSTTYPVMVEPPLLTGAVQLKFNVALPGVIAKLIGEEAFALATTEDDAASAGPVPAALTADTRTKYCVPFCKPVSVASNAVVLKTEIQLVPSVDFSTTYAVITAPPSEDGAVQVTVAERSAAVTTTDAGADAVVAGFTMTGVDGTPSPMAFTARTRT